MPTYLFYPRRADGVSLTFIAEAAPNDVEAMDLAAEIAEDKEASSGSPASRTARTASSAARSATRRPMAMSTTNVRSARRRLPPKPEIRPRRSSLDVEACRG